MKLKYSPDAREKLANIKQSITLSNGKSTADKVISNMMTSIRNLTDNPQKGPSVENMLGIVCPYRFLHIEHNYIFYRIENDNVYITDIYNERENFMQQMFGIKLRTKDSIEYWKD